MHKGLAQARDARTLKVLEKLYRSDGKIITLAQLIEKRLADGWTFATAEVPRIEYNRLKYNRMNHEEQREYEQKLKETKTEYRLVKEDLSFSIPKLAFDYYNS